jgi:hypothetical protein
MSHTPAFRQIGTPLTVADTDLDRINQRLGVPTLVPTNQTPVLPSPMTPPVPLKAVNVHLPDYVVRALKAKALATESSVRYLIMKALVDAGIVINPTDLVLDARRTQQDRGL